MEPDQEKPVPVKRYWETADFWKDAGERVVTSFLWGTISLMSVDIITGPEINIGIKKALLAGGIAASLSSVKAIVGAQRKDSITPVGIL